MNLNELMLSEDTDTPPGNESATTEDSSEPLEVIEVPKNINFRFQSDIGTLYYDQLEITNLMGLIEIKEGRVLLNQVKMNLLDGEMKLSGEYNTQDMLNPLVDFFV